MSASASLGTSRKQNARRFDGGGLSLTNWFEPPALGQM
jgi:hypothetical protein